MLGNGLQPHAAPEGTESPRARTAWRVGGGVWWPATVGVDPTRGVAAWVPPACAGDEGPGREGPLPPRRALGPHPPGTPSRPR